MMLDLDFADDHDAMVAARADAERIRAIDPETGAPLRYKFVGEVTAASVDALKLALLAGWTATAVEIEIDSSGGDVLPAIDAYLAVANHPARQKTAIIKNAFSSALNIALGCDRRVARSDACILLHRCAIETHPRKRWTASDLIDQAETASWFDRQIVRLVVEAAGADPADIEAEMQTEEETPLERALALGLIHEVLP